MDEWLDIIAVVERAQELIDLGLLDEAKVLLERYIQLYKDEWELPFLYSRICSEQNKIKEAITFLHQALKLDADNLDCLLGLFYSYAQLNQIEQGYAYLKQAQALHTDNELVLNAVIWYQTETGNFSKAVEYYESGQNFLSHNVDALRNAGIAYEHLGNHEQACSCYEKALILNPHFDEVRDLLADQYLLDGMPQKSVTLYEDYLTLSPKNIKALSRLVFCLMQNNQIKDAERCALQTISLYPNSPVGYVDMAYIYLNSDRIEKALASVDKALDVAPIDAEAMRVKALILSDIGDNEAAEKAFETALSLEPNNPEIGRDYYQHLRDAGNFSRMLEIVHQVIAQENPYCVEDYWFLADYYRQSGKNVQAFRYLHKAYKSMPGETELIPPMVDILVDTGHFTKALPFLYRYVANRGWNEVMDGFARHRRLRDKWTQESLRFLRFQGLNPRVFREYLFNLYFTRFLTVAVIVIIPIVTMFAFVCFKIPGLIISVCITAVGLLSFKFGRHYFHNIRKPALKVAKESA